MKALYRSILVCIASTAIFFSVIGIGEAPKYVDDNYGRASDGYGPMLDTPIMWVILVIGVGLLIVALAGLLRRLPVAPLPLLSAILTLMAGFVLGTSLGAMTTTTIDANIGAGLGLIFGLPIGAVLVVVALLLAIRHDQSQSQSEGVLS